MNNGTLIVAYHGCDVILRDDLVTGKVKELKASKNKYDWLGHGAYFFEGDAKRALKFAKASADNPEKIYTAKPIGLPAVVGAVLRASHCLDMTTQAGQEEYEAAYNLAKPEWDTWPVAKRPINQAASKEDEEIILRELDSAVINLVHSYRQEQNLEPYDMVRGAFQQGKPLATSSAFHANTHVQLAIRNPACILGWFLPDRETLLTPDQRAVALEHQAIANAQRLEIKKAAGKPPK